MEKHKSFLRRFWDFLQEDSLQSWIVSLLLLIVLIKFVVFPGLTLITGSKLPLVVVESCSMYHAENFDDWWFKNGNWYENEEITKEQFEAFPMKNGFAKGDIIFVWGYSDYKSGDIVVFAPNTESTAKNPIIHRIVATAPFGTKGDNNQKQLVTDNNAQKIDETNIPAENMIGKAVFRIPALGWIKLIFFEFIRPKEQRGLCI